MTTTTLEKAKALKKINVQEFAATVGVKFSESIGDMVVTVAITGITLAYMLSIMHPVYAATLPGLYILGMLVQLFIRIVHRFDDSYTVDELAERFIEFKEEVNERLDALIRNS